MAKASDTPERRLERFFQENKRRSNKLDEAGNKLLALVESQIRKNAELEAEKDHERSTTIGEFHDAIRAMMRQSLIADYILTLDPDNERDKPLAAAFAAAGLDHKNPFHWKLLLREFAFAHFVPKRGGGAPEKWSADRYGRLLAQVHQLKLKNPSLNDRRACEYLRKGPDYQQKSGKPLSVDRLRKALREARNPDFNVFLSKLLERSLINARAERQKNNLPWTPEIETEGRKIYIEQIIGWISTNWKTDGNKT